MPPVDGSWPEVPRRPDGLRHPLVCVHYFFVNDADDDNHDEDVNIAKEP